MSLARRGFRVLGLDAHQPPHQLGSHHGGTRSIRRAYLEGSSYVPMAMESWELWRKLERDKRSTLLVKAAFHNGLARCDPKKIDKSVSFAEVSAMKNVLAKFIQDLPYGYVDSEVCLYTMTADGDFYLGRPPAVKNIFAVALAGHGFKFAPVLGEMLADLLTEKPPVFNIENFSPRRFP